MIYAVIDTNVIVSAFITHHHDSPTVKVLNLLYSGNITPPYNKEIISEYIEVLSRKKFNIQQTAIDGFISVIVTYGINIDRVHTDVVMPDEDDRVFYEVSLSRDKALLITGNLKHYPVSPKIINPSDFITKIGSNMIF